MLIFGGSAASGFLPRLRGLSSHLAQDASGGSPTRVLCSRRATRRRGRAHMPWKPYVVNRTQMHHSEMCYVLATHHQIRLSVGWAAAALSPHNLASRPWIRLGMPQSGVVARSSCPRLFRLLNTEIRTCARVSRDGCTHMHPQLELMFCSCGINCALVLVTRRHFSYIATFPFPERSFVALSKAEASARLSPGIIKRGHHHLTIRCDALRLTRPARGASLLRALCTSSINPLPSDVSSRSASGARRRRPRAPASRCAIARRRASEPTCGADGPYARRSACVLVCPRAPARADWPAPAAPAPSGAAPELRSPQSGRRRRPARLFSVHAVRRCTAGGACVDEYPGQLRLVSCCAPLVSRLRRWVCSAKSQPPDTISASDGAPACGCWPPTRLVRGRSMLASLWAAPPVSQDTQALQLVCPIWPGRCSKPRTSLAFHSSILPSPSSAGVV
jgi:hypothetical protein